MVDFRGIDIEMEYGMVCAEGRDMNAHTPKGEAMKLTGTALKSVKPIITATFPNYAGRKVFLRPAQQAPKELRSYWDGGSKDSYAFFNLDTKEVLAVHSNHPFFEANQPSKLRELPAHIVLVEHSIFCGKDCGVTLYGNLAPMIEA